MNRELKEILRAEKALYYPPYFKTLRNKLAAWYTRCEPYEVYRFICALRKAEYYEGKNKLLRTYYLRKSNTFAIRLGYWIEPGVLGKGVRLWHKGIIINPESKIGDGCVFHGDNCVGNNLKTNDCPVLGKNVDLGVGAKMIGPVTLADGIHVGANAVVAKSFTEPGITIAGIPAVKIK